MVVDKGNTVSAPISVAARIAALQKGDSNNACKSSTAHKLPTADRPPSTMSKESNALADRIAMFQTTAEKAEDSRLHLNSILVHTKPSISIHSATDCDRSDGRTTDITTKSSSTFTKTNGPSNDQPPAKPNTIALASRISAMQKTMGPESRSMSAHPSRNVTTSIQSTIDPAATQPPEPSVLQVNTQEVQSITKPDHLIPMRELTMTDKAAVDDVTNSYSSLNQTILNDSGVHVKPPKPTRQAPILKDISNRMRNKIDAKKSANLQSKSNSKLGQEAHHGQSIEYGVRNEKENTQVETHVEEDSKSSTGVSDSCPWSDVDSDMITLPASNKNATLETSFDNAISWNYENTINGYQGFYKNFDLPTPAMMLESQISTPVTKNTRRKNNYNDNNGDDLVVSQNVTKNTRRKNNYNNNNGDNDLVVSQKNERIGNRNKRNHEINPPQRDRIRITTGNTDGRQNGFDTVGSNDDDNLNGCLLMDEIWNIFTSMSS